METEEILNEREKTHGDYKHVARLSWSFKHTVREELNSQEKDMRRNVDIGQQEAVEMILHKIARIICGDPNHADHWDDIAGYAMLGKGKRIGCGRCGKYRRDKLARCECMQGERVIRQEDMPPTAHMGEKFLFEEGRFGPVDEKEWFKTEPCQHPSRNKIKRFHTDIKDEVSYLLITADCLECGHVHILDFMPQKEEAVEAEAKAAEPTVTTLFGCDKCGKWRRDKDYTADCKGCEEVSVISKTETTE